MLIITVCKFYLLWGIHTVFSYNVTLNTDIKKELNASPVLKSFAEMEHEELFSFSKEYIDHDQVIKESIWNKFMITRYIFMY